jgi:hypothetical protein
MPSIFARIVAVDHKCCHYDLQSSSRLSKPFSVCNGPSSHSRLESKHEDMHVCAHPVPIMVPDFIRQMFELCLDTRAFYDSQSFEPSALLFTRQLRILCGPPSMLASAAIATSTPGSANATLGCR